MRDEEFKDDAWKKLHDVWEQNSKEWKPSDDLRVEALGPDRAVRVSIGKRNESSDRLHSQVHPYNWQDTGPRNVITMRGFAQAILDACDFVDEVNPAWASYRNL